MTESDPVSRSEDLAGSTARGLLLLMDMPNQDFTRWPHDEPAETGPDYVALVIEWEDVADASGTPTTTQSQLDKAPELLPAGLLKKLALGAGALAALLFARWGIQRLRHA